MGWGEAEPERCKAVEKLGWGTAGTRMAALHVGPERSPWREESVQVPQAQDGARALEQGVLYTYQEHYTFSGDSASHQDFHGGMNKLIAQKLFFQRN